MDERQQKSSGDAVGAELCVSSESACTAKSGSEATSSDILELFYERVAIMLESGVDQAKTIRTAYAQVRQAYGKVKLPDEITEKVSKCL